MPLQHSKSKEAFKSNIKAEIAAGKPQKQAVAIAYSEQRRAPKAKGGYTLRHMHEVPANLKRSRTNASRGSYVR
jgi:hypothetical protein